MVDPGEARPRWARRHLVSAAKLPIAGLGVNRISMLKTTLKIGAGILATVTIAGGIVTAGKHDERKKEAIEKAIAAPGPISVDGVKYSVRSFDKAPEGCQKLGAYRVLSSEGNLIAIASKPDAFRTVCTGKLQNG